MGIHGIFGLDAVETYDLTAYIGISACSTFRDWVSEFVAPMAFIHATLQDERA